MVHNFSTIIMPPNTQPMFEIILIVIIQCSLMYSNIWYVLYFNNQIE